MEPDEVQEHEARSRVLKERAKTELARFPDTRDWEIVILFYSAVHLVQAYMLTKNERFDASNHSERWRAIRGSPELMKGGRFPTSYKHLKDVSEQVRYDPGFMVSATHANDAWQDLTRIESFITSKIKTALEKAAAH